MNAAFLSARDRRPPRPSPPSAMVDHRDPRQVEQWLPVPRIALAGVGDGGHAIAASARRCFPAALRGPLTF